MKRHWLPFLILAVALALAPAALRAGEADAKKQLEAAIAAQDVGRARDALKALAADPGEKSVKAVAAAAAAARDLDIYADLVQALVNMAGASDAALKETVAAASKHADWTVRFLFVDALAAVDKPEARQALFAAFDDKQPNVAVQAMKVSATHRLKAAVSPLIDACDRFSKKKDDERLATEARLALCALTGESFGSAGDWRRWWEANEAAFDPTKVEEKKKARDEEGNTVLRRVEDRGEYGFLEKLEKGDIIVVRGKMDQCQEVLDVLKLPYTLITREEALSKLPTLDARPVIVYNCDSIPEKKLGPKDAAALAAWVERGGYLFTTDWVLTEAIIPAMKGPLEAGPMTQQQPFEAKIAPSRAAATHPYMRDVFPANPYEQAKMKWKFDTLCCTIKPGQGATSLVECDELGKKNGLPCVAATFRHGKGAVLHMIGHFRQQKDGAGDGFAMQQMLVNFIVEKQKFRAKGK